MTQGIGSIWRLVIKVLPFIVSLVFTFLIFFFLFDYHPAIGTVSTEIVSVWI
ncbi:hypothetical protein ACFLRT_03205 [Acidobacteriota bacterium]